MIHWLNNAGCLEERKICSWINNTDAEPEHSVLFLTAGSLIQAALCQSCRETNYTANRCYFIDAMCFVCECIAVERA